MRLGASGSPLRLKTPTAISARFWLGLTRRYLFATIDTVGRRLGVKPPSQVRLTYLPCCGVVAWGRSRALLIGLPLFRVLTQGELRAIVAHELAHLARGDATAAARSARFVEALEQAVERNGRRVRGPLGAWARFCLREASWLIEPVARGQEARADRCRRHNCRRQLGLVGFGQSRRGATALSRGPLGLRRRRDQAI